MTRTLGSTIVRGSTCSRLGSAKMISRGLDDCASIDLTVSWSTALLPIDAITTLTDAGLVGGASRGAARSRPSARTTISSGGHRCSSTTRAPAKTSRACALAESDPNLFMVAIYVAKINSQVDI